MLSERNVYNLLHQRILCSIRTAPSKNILQYYICSLREDTLTLERFFVAITWSENKKTSTIYVSQKFQLSIKMASFRNLTVEESIAKLRSIDGYENILRQQLESIFITPYSPKPTLKPVTRPKKCTPTPSTKPKKNS